MENLYSDLANIYEAMYQTFIDYEDEYLFYSQILRKNKKQTLLEIGSGTGNLAHYFFQNNFSYEGLDFSEDMIKIAQSKNKNASFLQGDMRDFILEKPIDSILITGRTISYLLKNEDVNATFFSINKNLKPGGIVCFDFIDASQFIPEISEGKKITHKVVFENIEYRRDSFWSMTLKNGFDFRWISHFFQKENQEWKKIGEDDSVIRTFTKDELEVYLELNGFRILEKIERAAYAFPTIVLVAEKK